MELRQLRYALSLAEHGQFGRAARSLGIAQPSLSRQIATLEQELGTPLFVRTASGVVPTAAGSVWTDRARRLLEDIDRGADEARRAARGETGVLRLAFVGSALIQLLPSLLARFRGTHPGVVLQAVELSSTRSTAALLADEIDVAISRGSPRGRGAEDLTSVALPYDNLVAVCHRAHPLASQPTITTRQLRGGPLVTTTSDDEPATIETLQAALGDLDAGGDSVRARDVHTIVGLAACGAGVGLVPSCARSLSRPEVVFVEVRPTVRLPDLCLVTRTADTSPVLAAFMAVTADHCPDVRAALAARS